MGRHGSALSAGRRARLGAVAAGRVRRARPRRLSRSARRPVQLTATGASASSACQVAASATPLAVRPWAVWKAIRLAFVSAPK